jgi:hypothetical protein
VQGAPANSLLNREKFPVLREFQGRRPLPMRSRTRLLSPVSRNPESKNPNGLALITLRLARTRATPSKPFPDQRGGRKSASLG